MASKAAYGVNPHAGINPNVIPAGWGPYQWPFGVPANLLAAVTVPGNVKIVIRKELATLVGLMFSIAWVKYGRNFSTGWTGGYENRKIASSWATPSNHSKGRAFDVDARNNPMSSTFICDIPPGLVKDWETLGWYWGGRYSGATDTMHFEFPMALADVPKFEAIARNMLADAGSGVNPIPQKPGTPPAPQPTKPVKDWFDMASQADLIAALKAVLQGEGYSALVNTKTMEDRFEPWLRSVIEGELAKVLGLEGSTGLNFEALLNKVLNERGLGK